MPAPMPTPELAKLAEQISHCAAEYAGAAFDDPLNKRADTWLAVARQCGDLCETLYDDSSKDDAIHASLHGSYTAARTFWQEANSAVIEAQENYRRERAKQRATTAHAIHADPF